MAVPLVAASTAQVEACCGRLGAAAGRLAARFWPGPLSLVLDAPVSVAPDVHGGGQSIAVRVPAHRVARSLCEAWGRMLTATSANPSGGPPAHTIEELAAWEHDARILAVDAGATPGGPPSTIVDVRGPAARLVRDGAIGWDRVLESLQE